MNIVAPYRSSEVEVIRECNLSRTDKVERSGYIRPEDRIKTFIETGVMLQSSRGADSEYDIPGNETDAEPDSVEYVEELERDAENFKEAPLAQFIDKMEACEVLAQADLALSEASNSSKRDKTRKDEKDASKEFLDGLETKIVEGIKTALTDTKVAE